MSPLAIIIILIIILVLFGGGGWGYASRRDGYAGPAYSPVYFLYGCVAIAIILVALRYLGVV